MSKSVSSDLPKTNAMRRLDAAKIPYVPKTYIVDENDLSGVHIADQLGLPYDQMFKNLVAVGNKTGPLVFCLPVDKEIDLKKAAAITGNKKMELVHVRDLLALTGYIRGGCSPIGMKKKFPTYFDASVKNWEEITVSAGCRGIQLLLPADKLLHFLGAQCADFSC